MNESGRRCRGGWTDSGLVPRTSWCDIPAAAPADRDAIDSPHTFQATVFVIVAHPSTRPHPLRRHRGLDGAPPSVVVQPMISTLSK